MRSPLAVIAIGTIAALTACDDSPLPQRLVAPEQPNNFLLMQPQWTVTRLPFRPRGINDAGVIVGSLSSEAIRWQNGTMKALLHKSAFAPQAAVAVAPQGKILGNSGGAVLLWTTPDSAPKLFGGYCVLTPVAINDAGAFVVNNLDSATYCTRGAMFYDGTSWMNVIRTQVGTAYTVVTGMNNAGSMSGRMQGASDSVAVRWVHGLPTALPTFGGSSSGEAINGRGDVVGWTSLGATLWGEDNSVQFLAGIAVGSKIVGLNDAGRVVGNEPSGGRAFTYFGGTMTYLPLLEAGNPTITGVNACGWIIGVGAGDYGFLWKRASTTNAVCDAPSMPVAM